MMKADSIADFTESYPHQTDKANHMADNYLGRKMEEYMTKPDKQPHTRHPHLTSLMERCRSYRGYDHAFQVRDDQLRDIISVYRFVPSARNRQELRFRPVLKEEAAKVNPWIQMGAGLKDLHLPLTGTEPEAFIIVCSVMEEDRYVDMDLGIAAEAMLLRATEMGLAGICIAAFDRQKIRENFNLELEPMLILAFGRGAEKIRIKDIGKDESHAYYRDNCVHVVPKVRLEDLIL